MPGATAYFGLKEVAKLKKDDLVLVSVLAPVQLTRGRAAERC